MMKKCKLSMLAILFSTATSFGRQTYVPGVVLVKVSQPDSVSIVGNQVLNGGSQFQAILDNFGLIDSERLPHVTPMTNGWYRLAFNENAPVEQIKSALDRIPDIAESCLDHIGILASTPNDPLWPYQWALQRTNMPAAWDIIKADNSVLVGIMDDGIDWDHTDLIDNIWQNLGEDDDNDGHTLEYVNGSWVLDPGDLTSSDDSDGNGYEDDLIGWDFIDSDKNSNPPQEDTHGTKVAGVVSARTYNGVGVAGIAGGWQTQTGVRLIPLRIAQSTRGPDWTESRAYAAISYLTELRQRGNVVIANMSIQTDGSGDEPMNLFKNGITEAGNAGVIMVSAAGNTVEAPNSPYHTPHVNTLPIPARYSKVIAIGGSKDGATIQDERRSTYSLYDDQEKLFMVAPVDTSVDNGFNVFTTKPGGSYYGWFNGTSAACPIVTGTVALLLSWDPLLTWGEIEMRLGLTAEKIGQYDYNLPGPKALEVGYGRLNAHEALPPTVPTGFSITGSNGDSPTLHWNANPESDLDHYNIYRKVPGVITYSFLASTTTTQYTDNSVTISRFGDPYCYRITAVDYIWDESGKTNPNCVDGDGPVAKMTILTPDTYQLNPNYPNPFNPVTTIKYDLPENSLVTLKLYDLMGHEVATLVNGSVEAGYQNDIWDGKDSHGNPVSSGMYLYRLGALSTESEKEFHLTRKMILLR